MEEEAKNLKSEETHYQTQFKMNLVQFVKSDEPISPDIDVVRYSNQMLINLTENDVMLDFLELPGIVQEGKMHVRGTRIYLTIEKAKKLHEVLGNILYK